MTACCDVTFYFLCQCEGDVRSAVRIVEDQPSDEEQGRAGLEKIRLVDVSPLYRPHRHGLQGKSNVRQVARLSVVNIVVGKNSVCTVPVCGGVGGKERVACVCDSWLVRFW